MYFFADTPCIPTSRKNPCMVLRLALGDQTMDEKSQIFKILRLRLCLQCQYLKLVNQVSEDGHE